MIRASGFIFLPVSVRDRRGCEVLEAGDAGIDDQIIFHFRDKIGARHPAKARVGEIFCLILFVDPVQLPHHAEHQAVIDGKVDAAMQQAKRKGRRSPPQPAPSARRCLTPAPATPERPATPSQNRQTPDP